LISATEASEFAPTGVILSGGPYSVYDADGPHLKPDMWQFLEENKLPILGICYGLQEMCHKLGGQVEPGIKREFGHSELVLKDSILFKSIDTKASAQVWMSHGDKVTELPKGFVPIANTSNCEYAAVEDVARRMCNHP